MASEPLFAPQGPAGNSPPLICIIAVSGKCAILHTMEPTTEWDEATFSSLGGVSREGELIALIREFVHELHPQQAKFLDFSPSSRLAASTASKHGSLRTKTT